MRDNHTVVVLGVKNDYSLDILVIDILTQKLMAYCNIEY